MGTKASKSAATARPENVVEEPRPGGAFHVSPDPVVAEPIADEAHKFDIGPTAASGGGPGSSAPAFESLGELPQSYHEDTLFLVARDPRWLFCYWDFDWARAPRGEFRGGVPQFFLKIMTAAGAQEALVEIKPEARNWYVPVSRPATSYLAEIGWFDTEDAWHAIVKSRAATTPADALAGEDLAAQFATVPAHIAFERLLEMVRGRMEEGESLLQAVARVAGDGRIEFAAGKEPTWTDEQKHLLAALLGESLVDRAGLGSAELDQLLRKRLQESLSSESASGFSQRFAESLAPGPHSLFSGIGASWSAQPFSVHRERGFFMHVNAEIIFYGGTHPDATVWVDGRQIKLSPDGTFRYHFKLPDGEYAIPIVAQAPDKVEQRSATLSFRRGTARAGDVGHTAQPPYLDPPLGRK